MNLIEYRVISSVEFLYARRLLCAAEPNGADEQSTTWATDWRPVDLALGKAGSMQPGDVYKVSLPRSDLKVFVDGVQIKAPLAPRVMYIHIHAMGDAVKTPRLFFMHFWANDDALKLARGIRAALNKTNSAK